MSIDLDNKEIQELLTCIETRIDIIRDDVNTFKGINETALNSEINDALKLSTSCDKIISSYQKEYLLLIYLRKKFLNSEE